MVLLLTLGLFTTATACGFDVQTSQPYTPAQGVNLDAGPDGTLKIRNLMILTREDGEGFLSASIVTDGRDTLTGVSGSPYKVDGSAGTPFTVELADPVAFGNSVLVVLTNRTAITLKSADLKPGLDAKLVLQFSSAGEVTLNVPIVDANQPDYATVSPSPAPSAGS